jgi:hypothetical protein
MESALEVDPERLIPPFPFQPAITLALFMTGAMDWVKCLVLTIVQFVGGIAAAALVSGLLPGSVNAQTSLGPDTSVVQGFFLEFFLTCQLIFAVLMLAAEKHKATFLAPVGIGLTLFITQLLGQSYTGAGVNPARSLGPDTVTGNFYGYSWIYYIAPYCAAIVTAGFYTLLKWLRYETTSPDQDAHEEQGQYRQVMHDLTGKAMGTIDTVEARYVMIFGCSRGHQVYFTNCLSLLYSEYHPVDENNIFNAVDEMISEEPEELDQDHDQDQEDNTQQSSGNTLSLKEQKSR